MSDKNRPLEDRIGVLQDNAPNLQSLRSALDMLKALNAKKPDTTRRKQIADLEDKIELEIKTKISNLNG